MISLETDEALDLLYTVLVHNPYNVKAHLTGIAGVVEAVVEDEYLDRDQEMALWATLYWHIPPTMAHIGVRMGLIPAVSGGFGYFKTLSTMPKIATGVLWLNLAYMLHPHVDYAIENQNPYDIVRITGGTGGAYKPPGSHHFAFRNPVTGM